MRGAKGRGGHAPGRRDRGAVAGPPRPLSLLPEGEKKPPPPPHPALPPLPFPSSCPASTPVLPFAALFSLTSSLFPPPQPPPIPRLLAGGSMGAAVSGEGPTGRRQIGLCGFQGAVERTPKKSVSTCLREGPTGRRARISGSLGRLESVFFFSWGGGGAANFHPREAARPTARRAHMFPTQTGPAGDRPARPGARGSARRSGRRHRARARVSRPGARIAPYRSESRPGPPGPRVYAGAGGAARGGTACAACSARAGAG